MSTDTYAFETTAVDADTLDLEIRALDPSWGIDVSPTLVFRALSDLYPPLRDVEPTAEGKVLEAAKAWILGLEVLQSSGPSARFRVRLPPDCVAAVSGRAWRSTAYASDFPEALDAVGNSKADKVLVGWRSWPGGPGRATLHALGKKGLSGVKAWLDHPGLTAVAGHDTAWFTGGGSEVREWSTAGKRKKTHRHPDVRALAWAGDTLLVGLGDGRVVGLDGAERARLDGPVTALAASGSHWVAGSAAGTLSVSGAPVRLGDAPVEDVAIDPTGAWAAVQDGQLHHGAGGRRDCSEVDAEVRPMALWQAGLDGTRAAFAQVQSVALLDLADPAPRFLEMPVKPVECGRWGQNTWAGSRDRLLAWAGDRRVVDAQADFSLGMSPNVKPVFSPSGAWLATRRDGDPLGLFEMSTGRCVPAALPASPWGAAQAHGLAWLDDETVVVQLNDGYKILCYRVDGGGPTPFEIPVGALDPMPDRLFSVHDETTLAVYAGRERIAALPTPRYTKALVASADGRVVLTTNWQTGQGALWKDGAAVVTLPHLESAAISPSGRWVVFRTAVPSSAVELWDTASCARAATVAPEPFLLTVDDDGTVRGPGADGLITFRRTGETSVWTPQPMALTFRYRSVAAGPAGFVGGSDRSQEPRVAVFADGRVLRMGAQLRLS